MRDQATTSAAGEAPTSTHKRRVAMVSPEEAAPEPTAWPTVFFFFLPALAAWVLPLALTWQSPRLWTVPVSTLANYVLYTVMHEALHRNVSVEHRWLNEVLGRVCSVPFQGCFPAFRHLHLEHHKYTNDPLKDPDAWSAGCGVWWLLPFFWATQGSYYYYFYARQLLRGERPAREGAEVLLTAAGSLGALAWLAAAGHVRPLLLLVLLPRMLAEVLLAYVLDYAPHHPHQVTRAEDPYASTGAVGGWVSLSLEGHGHADEEEEEGEGELLGGWAGALLTAAMLFHNFHVVHHLYPRVAFYKQPAIYRRHAARLRELGSPVVALLQPHVRLEGGKGQGQGQGQGQAHTKAPCSKGAEAEAEAAGGRADEGFTRKRGLCRKDSAAW